jgi:gliding motility-associated-like protein
MFFLNKFLGSLIAIIFFQQIAQSQTCPTINAQAGTGASTTICLGQCANLTATVVPVKATTSYSVGSIGYNPYPFSGGTAAIGNIDDLWSSTINIGFNFCYFGNTFNQLLVGSNGEITFDVSVANGAESFAVNNVLPNLIEHQGNTICVAYRDINPSAGTSSSVFTYTSGTAPCRKFITYWSNVPLFQCNTPTSKFMVVLHESTNEIETFIENSTSCPIWQSGRGLMGIQNSTGTIAVAPAGRNVLTAWNATNEAWRYVPTGANTFTVNWSGPNGFTANGLTASPCPTTTSTYTATMNVSNCAGVITTFSSSVQVSVTPSPTAPIVATPTAICRGASSILSSSGATSYTWMPGGASTPSISVSPTVTTTYTLTKTNGSCTNTQTLSLIVHPLPTINITRSPAVICGSGSSTLTATGASTYTWNPGSITGNPIVVTPTSTTVYTVTGTNTNGCINTRTTTITVSNTPTINASVSSPTACSGSTISLTATGGTSYTWSPGNITGASVVATPTSNTTYTVIGRNSSGCTNTNTVNVSVIPGITFTVTATPTIICRGGTSTLTATGATSYTWIPGALTGSNVSVSPSVTTVYTVTGNSGGICSATKHITVTVSVPNITATKTPTAVCAGNSATLTAGGGVTYTWTPGNISGTPIVVTPTTTIIYTVTGTNTLGCTNTRTVSLPVNANPTVNISSSSSTICSGSSATLTASGAIAYTWTPGSLTTTNIVVSPTTTNVYTVTGRNASGCRTTATINVGVYPNTIVSVTSNPIVICNGNTATLTASGASSYTWNPGALSGSSVSVSPNSNTTYTVLGIDGNGCRTTSTLQLNVSNVSITASSNPTILCSSPTATLSATGATTYTWNPGALTGNSVVVTPTASTVYTVIATNTLGCTGTRTLNLSVGTTPTVTASASSNTICAGNTITLTTSGANTYTWLPGSLTGSNVLVSPGTNTTYTVRGRNLSGCEGTNTINITVNPTPSLTAFSTPIILCSGSQATLTASGATSYTWNPGAMTGSSITVNPLVTTVYTVVASNTLNCTTAATVDLKVTATPTINITSSSNTVCAGNSATLTGSGANTYTWNPGALTGSTISVTPTVNTTYTLTGDNGFGCTSSTTIALSIAPTPTVIPTSSSNSICVGSSATLTASGANSYTWNPGVLTNTIVVVTPTITTTYTLDGDNGNGCIGTNTVTINVNAIPSLSIAPSTTILCSSAETVTMTASGAATYTWMPLAAVTPTVIDNPTVTTTYTVTGEDALGCSNTQSITIFVGTTPTISISTSTTTICSGNSVTLTAMGATNYTWNPGSITNSTTVISPSVTTTYTVLGDNGTSCVGNNTVTINVNITPTLSINSTSTLICAPTTITLTANGGTTYTWSPIVSNTTTVVDSPTITTTYSVSSDDGNGCIGTNSITINVGANPTLSISAFPTGTICSGTTVSLTASGATNYTWSPVSLNTASITETPTITTTYTITGENGIGCVSTETVLINVATGTSVTAVANPTTICANSTTTLTASGATTYTWMPDNSIGSTIISTPSISTTYTVFGDNGICVTSSTVFVDITSGPNNVTANVSGTLSCLTSSVNLLGSTTSSSVTYLWNGPSSYTSSVQNPSGINTSGLYTLTVTDAVTGCTTTETVNVMSDTTIPNLNASVSGALGCALTVTLNASTTSTNSLSYNWAGPLSYTSTIQTPTTNISGDYTITATDQNNGCINTTTITVISNTTIPTFTAISIAATCTGTLANNDGSLVISGYNSTDTYDFSQAATYTGTLTYSTANTIPVGGVLTNTLVNPTVATPYTIRVFGNNGCFKDTTVMLMPTVCNPTLTANVLGMTKAVSTPTIINNNAYNVTYTLVATNASTVNLTNFSIIDNLNNTFPLPTTFSVISAPAVTSLNSSLTINTLFDGVLQNDLLLPATSTLTANKKDTIVFTVQINPNGVFGTFNNSAIGFGFDGTITVSDSSNTGFAWDPDNNGDPTNNDIPTALNLTPNTQIGIAKLGELSEILPDKTIDITYTIIVSNLGNDTIKFVQVNDSILLKSPAQFTIKSSPAASGSLIANGNYNGVSDIALLVSNGSVLSPGQSETITFVLNITPNEVKSITNVAIGAGFGANGNVVRDSSNTGSIADVNGNGIASEQGENTPTINDIPDVNLFIPEVFTPDGDNKNDLFTIKGIEGRTVKITVFNRWGNKVYHNDAYDNTWNGTANVNGLQLGNNKLPQGTYYYIIEFEDGADEPVNGYVVIQY